MKVDFADGGKPEYPGEGIRLSSINFSAGFDPGMTELRNAIASTQPLGVSDYL